GRAGIAEPVVPDRLVTVLHEAIDVERRRRLHVRRGLAQHGKVALRVEVEPERVVGRLVRAQEPVAERADTQREGAGDAGGAADLGGGDAGRREETAVIAVALDVGRDVVLGLLAGRGADQLAVGARALVDVLDRLDLCGRETGRVLRPRALQ